MILELYKNGVLTPSDFKMLEEILKNPEEDYPKIVSLIQKKLETNIKKLEESEGIFDYYMKMHLSLTNLSMKTDLF